MKQINNCYTLYQKLIFCLPWNTHYSVDIFYVKNFELQKKVTIQLKNAQL